MTHHDTTHTQDQASRGRVRDGLDGARESASHAGEYASETIDTNPLAVLAGGLAIGALAGALLPRTDRERELLRPVGAKLGATAAAAFAAAKDAGRSEMEQRGLTKDSARDQAKSLFDNVAKAATGAASAGAKSARQEATGSTGEPAAADATDKSKPTGDKDEAAPAMEPHHQVMAGDRETSFNPGV